MEIFQKQLNNLTIYNNKKILQKYFDKWKDYTSIKKIKNELIKYRSKKLSCDKLISSLNNIQKMGWGLRPPHLYCMTEY